MFVDIGIEKFDAGLLNFSHEEINTYKEKKSQYFDTRALQDYLINDDSYLDAKKISDDFFPKISTDIFLSHSHLDEEDVIKLALRLENLGFSVFVDSCVWGWADKILKKIDIKYCRKDDKYYDYNLRNRTTSNVYMMLSCALQKAISQTELLLFLNTGNSLKMQSAFKNEEFIASPWIFSELNFASLCERSPRQTYRSLNETVVSTENFAMDSADVKFAYPNPGTRHSISNENFFSWLSETVSNRGNRSSNGRLEHLDMLYRQVGVSEEALRIPR